MTSPARFESIPNAEQQRLIIKNELKNQKLSLTEKAYLISTIWFRKWKVSSGFYTKKEPTNDCPPIENGCLLVNGVFNSSLVEGTDYQVISQTTWKIFLSWYGGGPVIAFDVAYDPVRKQNVAVTHLIKIFITYIENSFELTVSRYVKFKEIKDQALQHFNIKQTNKNITNDNSTSNKNNAYNSTNNNNNNNINNNIKINNINNINNSININKNDIESIENNNNNDNSDNNENNDHNDHNENNDNNENINNNETIKNNNKEEGREIEYSLYIFKDQICDDNKTLSELMVSDRQEFFLRESTRSNLLSSVSAFQMRATISPSLSQPFIQLIEKYTPGVCGFQNLGNTCFFNSGLQCLIHTMPLVQHIQTDTYIGEISEANPLGTKGVLVNAFGSILKEVWKGTAMIIAPGKLLGTVQKHAPHFVCYQQQDAHELILIVLDLIHEDLNRAASMRRAESFESCDSAGSCGCDANASLESVVGDGTNDEEKAKEAWKKYRLRNDSIIVDFFHGLLRSTLFCPHCHSTCVMFDPYVSLTVPLPNSRETYVQFTFVPFDAHMPKMLIRLPIAYPVDMCRFKALLFSEIGYECNLGFAVRNSAFEHRFHTAPPMQPASRGFQLLVFEVPNVESNFYCLVRLNFMVKGIFKDRVKFLDSYLMEVPKEEPSWEELQFAVDERFAYLWEGKCSKFDSELFMMKKNIVHFCQNQKNNTKLIFFDKNHVFGRFEKVPFLSQRILDVTINGEHVDDIHSHFNWERVERKTIEIPSKFTIVEPTLEQCLKEYSQITVLDEHNQWYCPKCNEHVYADKKMDIWSLPYILIVNFKRFSITEKGIRKIETKVEYPDTIDFSKLIKGPQRSTPQMYKLFGVIHHFGQLFGGHYTAHAYLEEIGKWCYFNDQITKMTTNESVHQQSAYVLFYQKII